MSTFSLDAPGPCDWLAKAWSSHDATLSEAVDAHAPTGGDVDGNTPAGASELPAEHAGRFGREVGITPNVPAILAAPGG